MRLITFVPPGGVGLHIGAELPAEASVVDFTVSLPGCPPTMRGFLEGGDALIAAATALIASGSAAKYPLTEVKLKVRFSFELNTCPLVRSPCASGSPLLHLLPS